MLASNSHCVFGLNMTKNKDDFDDDKDDADQDKSYVGVADERLTKRLRTSFYSTNGAPACPHAWYDCDHSVDKIVWMRLLYTCM